MRVLGCGSRDGHSRKRCNGGRTMFGDGKVVALKVVINHLPTRNFDSAVAEEPRPRTWLRKP